MRRLGLIPVGALAVALVACGSSSPSSPSTPTPSLSATSSGGGLQNESGSQVLDAAKSAYRSATSVEVKGSVTENGQQTQFDLKLQKSGETEGTLTVNGSAFPVVIAGDSLYFKASAQFYESKFGPSVAALIGDKWFKTSKQNPDFASFTAITFDGLISQAGAATATGPVQATTVDGQPAVVVTTSDGAKVTVANSGPAFPLSIEQGENSLTFFNYNSVPPITAPSPSIDLASLTQSGSPTATP